MGRRARSACAVPFFVRGEFVAMIVSFDIFGKRTFWELGMFGIWGFRFVGYVCYGLGLVILDLDGGGMQHGGDGI